MTKRPRVATPPKRKPSVHGVLEEQTNTVHRCANYSRWKRKFQAVYEKFITPCISSAPSAPHVKIAVLDTGVDLNHPDIQACAENIKARHNWLREGAKTTVHDLDGHGTFVAGVLFDYAPDAEIYVAKIADTKPASPHVIAKVSPSKPHSLDLLLPIPLAESLTRTRPSPMPWMSGMST